MPRHVLLPAPTVVYSQDYDRSPMMRVC